MTKHTPGPWRIAGTATVRAGDDCVCGVYRKNREANARLLAAAPEMYEALKAFASFERPEVWSNSAWRYWPDGDVLHSHATDLKITREDFRRAFAAIAKAEGRSA